MPLLSSQAIEPNIMDSLKDYLNQTIVIPYNQFAASSAFKNQLGIALSFPDDPSALPDLPVMVLGRPQNTTPPIDTGIGDNTQWEYWDFEIICFPSLTTDGKADHYADAMLRTYVRNFTRALYFPIIDYTVSGNPQIESARIMNSRLAVPQGKPNSILAGEKYMFYLRFTLEIPVVNTN